MIKILKEKEIKCCHCNGLFIGKKQEIDSRCPDCRKKYLQEWRRLPDSVERKARRHREVREIVFFGYGHKCACCGESRSEFLAIDHVNGGGGKERKTKSTRQIANRIIKERFPPEFRILCHNCNLSIGWYGYCPHEEGLKNNPNAMRVGRPKRTA